MFHSFSTTVLTNNIFSLLCSDHTTFWPPALTLPFLPSASPTSSSSFSYTVPQYPGLYILSPSDSLPLLTSGASVPPFSTQPLPLSRLRTYIHPARQISSIAKPWRVPHHSTPPPKHFQCCFRFCTHSPSLLPISSSFLPTALSPLMCPSSF